MVYSRFTMRREGLLSHQIESALTGEGATLGQRILTNAFLGSVYTLVDLTESKMYRTASGWVFDRKTKQLEEKLKEAVSVRNAHTNEGYSNMRSQDKEMQKLTDELQIQIIRDSIRNREAVRSGIDFAEEELSDRAATMVGQKVLDNITRFNPMDVHDADSVFMSKAADDYKYKHTYVKPLAENISGYANAIIQVFFNDKWIGFLNKDGTPKKFMGMMLAEKSANFVNPGNVEAGLRILSDLPFINRIVKPVKEGMDHLLEHNAIAGFINVGFNKFLLGYHVINTRVKAVERATAEIASKVE